MLAASVKHVKLPFWNLPVVETKNVPLKPQKENGGKPDLTISQRCLRSHPVGKPRHQQWVLWGTVDFHQLSAAHGLVHRDTQWFVR
jgi:hypothetical protein